MKKPEVCSQIEWNESFDQFQPVSASIVWSDPCHLNTTGILESSHFKQSWTQRFMDENDEKI